MRSTAVSLRKAKHDPLISFATFQKIQGKLDQGVYAPMRKDLRHDFPLRGAVACSGCGKMLTSAWCKGKYQSYPYYVCQNSKCDYPSSIPRDKVEKPFHELLKRLAPSTEMFELAKIMFDDLWNARQVQAEQAKISAKQQIIAVEKEIRRYLNLIVEAQNQSVIKAYENRIAELETSKLLLEENASKRPDKANLQRDLIKLSMKFLRNPAILWDSGSYGLRRLVLKLAFTGPIIFNRETGLLNTNFSMPFKVLGGDFMQDNKMVRDTVFRERVSVGVCRLLGINNREF